MKSTAFADQRSFAQCCAEDRVLNGIEDLLQGLCTATRVSKRMIPPVDLDPEKHAGFWALPGANLFG